MSKKKKKACKQGQEIQKILIQMLAECQYAESIRLDPYRIGSCELCQTAGCIAS